MGVMMAIACFLARMGYPYFSLEYCVAFDELL